MNRNEMNRGDVMKMFGIVVLANALMVGSFSALQVRAESGTKSDTASQGLSVAQAVRQAKKTGQPIFAVSVSDSCPACQALLKTLATETSLRPVLQQFVSLEINVDNPDFRGWERSFPRKSSSIPGVYVVASNGKQIFGDEGAMRGKALKQMLFTSLEKAGRYPTEEKWQEIAVALKATEKALQENQEQQAIEQLQPMLVALSTLGDLAELSETGIKASALVEQLSTNQRNKLDEAAIAFSDQGDLEAALQVAAAERLGNMFPHLKAHVTAEVKKMAPASEQRKLLRQARELHKAEMLAAEEDSAEKAVRALKRVIKRYPQTDASARAAEKLRLLENGGASAIAASADESPLRRWSDSSRKFSIKARLLEVKGDRVRLQQASGKVLTIPVAKLDEAGQRYLATAQP